jgi:hypothetical protein
MPAENSSRLAYRTCPYQGESFNKSVSNFDDLRDACESLRYDEILRVHNCRISSEKCALILMLPQNSETKKTGASR